ncbi:hypothetical protein GCM10010339_88370 [Streptomyces alanosinicus]|uniref:Uncharacterized protein n=1 Tax=Streptomyces alanosinicus TaxID=68171 RepID=A0A918YT11_9ACTN|nr:hypothetical protein GCM10010339_88370 [Streptomyces alanosinicus]
MCDFFKFCTWFASPWIRSVVIRRAVHVREVAMWLLLSANHASSDPRHRVPSLFEGPALSGAEPFEGGVRDCLAPVMQLIAERGGLKAGAWSRSVAVPTLTREVGQSSMAW